MLVIRGGSVLPRQLQRRSSTEINERHMHKATTAFFITPCHLYSRLYSFMHQKRLNGTASLLDDNYWFRGTGLEAFDSRS